MLLDGTSARELTAELEGVDGVVVLTAATVLPVASIERDSPAGACLQRFADRDARGSAVMRVGVVTESITFRDAAGRSVFGCANSPGAREKGRWCSGAYGQFRSGRLGDPRLSINCRARDETPIGFAWIEPGANAQLVAVEQPEYVEVYEVAAGLPVRVATVSGVDRERSAATFDVSEHDAEGRLLREYRLEAFVAG
jgi:hypothetical protein